MSYNIKYTDSENKGSIVVEDKTINNETSIGLPGKGESKYGTTILENLLHLLENFANSTSPDRPVEGQLWYDTSEGVNQLKVYDGTNWVASGGVKKSPSAPSASNSIPGELWVNTQNQQLYLFTGASWVLVGPTYSDGLVTGTVTETYVGTDNKEYTVLLSRVSNEIALIVSNDEFRPKSAIPGFRNGIKPGLNINNQLASSGMKYWGVSEKAENMLIDNETVPGSNFLRSDTESITNFKLGIKDNSGLTVGPEDQLSISIENSTSVIQNRLNGSSIDFRAKRGSRVPTIMKIDAEGYVGINNSIPTEALDIIGNAVISSTSDDEDSGTLSVNSTKTSDNISSGSITTAGGVGIAKSLHVGEDVAINGTITTNNILPAENNSLSIGSSILRYSSIHANTFFGNLQGNVEGTVTGRAGSSYKLTSSTRFGVTGDVQEDSFEFDGLTGGTSKTFNIRISNSFISDKEQVFDTEASDEILINRTVGESGTYKVSRRNFLKDVPVIPPGVLMPFGGIEPPEGWLFCDGSILKKSEYTLLWNTIGHNFKDPVFLDDEGVNSFALPDMRGRAPVGLDNLGGIDSNRVTNESAKFIGGSSGNEYTILSIENLPDHDHNLQGSTGTQYYSVRTASSSTDDKGAISMQVESGTGGTQGLPSSGGINTSRETSTPVDTMNPFLAVNYIIYTGI